MNPRQKKGQYFSISLVLFTLFFLLYMYVVLLSRQQATTTEGQVGDRAIQLLTAGSLMDQPSLYTTSSATLAAYESLTETARVGAMGPSSPCGIINGYSLWNTVEKPIGACLPDTRESFSTHFLNALMSHLSMFTTSTDEPLDLTRHYDISLLTEKTGTILIGTTSTPITMNFAGTADHPKLGVTMSTYPSFSTTTPDIITELTSLRNGAQTILDACKTSNDPFACASDLAYTLNTAIDAKLKWKTGPCAGDLATTDPRIVQFCVESPHRSLMTVRSSTGRTNEWRPLLWKFALTIAANTPVAIINFQANGNPPSGKPDDKGGIPLAPGQPLRYHGRIASPGLDGLAVSLCFTSGTKTQCEGIPSRDWNIETYSTTQQLSIASTLAPPIKPPFTLSLLAERGEQKDATAGIDIVPLLITTPSVNTPPPAGLASVESTQLNP